MLNIPSSYLGNLLCIINYTFTAAPAYCGFFSRSCQKKVTTTRIHQLDRTDVIFILNTQKVSSI
jgi:hypothetical protein